MVEEEPLNAAFTVVAGRAVVATVEETEEDAFVSPLQWLFVRSVAVAVVVREAIITVRVGGVRLGWGATVFFKKAFARRGV